MTLRLSRPATRHHILHTKSKRINQQCRRACMNLPKRPSKDKANTKKATYLIKHHLCAWILHPEKNMSQIRPDYKTKQLTSENIPQRRPKIHQRHLKERTIMSHRPSLLRARQATKSHSSLIKSNNALQAADSIRASTHPPMPNSKEIRDTVR